MPTTTTPLPNLRKIIVPDPGWYIGEADLAGADARVVAWEANDIELMDAFDAGLKVHAKNALDMWGEKLAGPDGLREPLYTKNKSAVHGTNYYGKPKGMSAALGWPVKSVEEFQRRWFTRHPRIRNWHDNVLQQLYQNHRVSNKFGYRIVYFGRVEDLLPEALAWIGQSTTSVSCMKGQIQLRSANFDWVQLLLDSHDSIVFQYREEFDSDLSSILDVIKVVVPYDRPLNMPWELKTSPYSWGEVKKRAWRI